MPTFPSPQPISVALRVVFADVRIIASDRTDTLVTVEPWDRSTRSERMAELTRVDLADGRLSVRGPKHSGFWFGTPGKIAVDIHLPAGSHLDGEASVGELQVDGELGDCRYRTGYGAIRVGRAARLVLDTGAGDVDVDWAAGDVNITTATGRLRVGRVDGDAVLKASNGETSVGEVAGTVRANAANGSISIDRAAAGATAKTASGALRIGEAVSGFVVLETGAGRIEVGIPIGTAAWLDLNTRLGAVRNTMDSATRPTDSDRTVQVRARTRYGDIVVHRA